MNKELVIEIFNKNTNGKNGIKGKRILNNDLITNVITKTEDEIIDIVGNVLSESSFSEYKTEIEIALNSREVFKTSCTCNDFEKNEFKKSNYCCKHIMATFYYFLQTYEFTAKKSSVLKELALEEGINPPSQIFKNHENNLLDILLSDSKSKEELKIDVYLNRLGYKNILAAEFKIGLKRHNANKLYVVKDINQFLTYYDNKVPIKYGKDFSFDIKTQRFNSKDSNLINFMQELRELESTHLSSIRKQNKLIDGKYIYPPNHLLKEFFTRIKDHRIFLNEGFYHRPVDCEILIDNPDLDFELKLLPSCYELRLNSSLPEGLNGRMDVLLWGQNIYIPSQDFIFKVTPYYEVFNGVNSISLPKSEEEKILRELIPELNGLTSYLNLSKNIREKVVIANPKFSFYFDKDNESFSLTLKVKYNQYEFNIFDDCSEKIIYRNIKEEDKIKSFLRALGFSEINNKFYLIFGEDYTYKFFKYEINKLQELGEVFYSENFKGIKSLSSNGIIGDISTGKYEYFELKFKLGDIPNEETSNILRAFRDNLKYYKLKTGEFLDLEEIELSKFLKLVDSLSQDANIENNIIEFSKSKGLYFDNYINEKELKYIKGKNHLKELKAKFKSISKMKYDVPKELKAILRPYQEIGYNWFKTLDYFGFGGILGDEMGLGKTLQTITFLLSNSGSHSLIIAPTSLIYNWKMEIKKFAPSLKVALVNSSKEEREELIKTYKNYDILITTYNLIRNDIEHYNKIQFNYIILDEAQNIKNPNSQNAVIIKSLNSKNRFALTGTPIENSLMELWSIFDFIMPGYLYDEKLFRSRYHRRLKESQEIVTELTKLIKPFILRRFKRDVALELPDKIEKVLEVKLPLEQQKYYGVYAKHVVDFIEKKVRDEEFNKGKIEVLAYITKLRQLCLDPSVVIENYTGENGKMEALIELLSQSIEENHKTLVFSQFTSVLNNIKTRLQCEDINHCYLDGSISSEKRMEMVEEFNHGGASVFLISLKAGGTGLNLTSADVVIHFDPWWNPAVEDQATDRAHRIGQDKVVEVIKLIAKDTIEEKIVALQEEKRELISKLLGDEVCNSEGLLSLSEDDIISLFH